MRAQFSEHSYIDFALDSLLPLSGAYRDRFFSFRLEETEGREGEQQRRYVQTQVSPPGQLRPERYYNMDWVFIGGIDGRGTYNRIVAEDRSYIFRYPNNREIHFDAQSQLTGGRYPNLGVYQLVYQRGSGQVVYMFESGLMLYRPSANQAFNAGIDTEGRHFQIEQRQEHMLWIYDTARDSRGRLFTLRRYYNSIFQLQRENRLYLARESAAAQEAPAVSYTNRHIRPISTSIARPQTPRRGRSNLRARYHPYFRAGASSSSLK